MRKMMNVFAGSALALVVGAGFAASSSAQDLTKDEAYCRQLVDTYRPSHDGGPWSESLDLSVAVDQCRSGNPEPAIPVLQKRLRDLGYTVPARS
jgi:hypothetical protein